MAWQAQQFTPDALVLNTVGTVVRLSGPVGHLSSPILVVAKTPSDRQLHIIHGETPMLFLADFDALDEAAAIAIFVKVAHTMTALEAEQGEFSIEEARRVAHGCLKSLLLAT